MTIASACAQEIVALHQFFEGWFHGRLPRTELSFNRLANVLAADFMIVSPDGRVTERDPLIQALQKSYSSWQAKSNGRIWIEKVIVRWQKGNLILVTYEEWQEIENNTTARLSTVLFELQPDLPNGLAWLHVHETWLLH